MKKNILITAITLFFLCSCTKKEFVILVEQPSNYKLDNLKLGITIDSNITENINLKATTITPSYITKVFAIANEQNHLLKIKANDILFNYQIYYPQEKYIIISPYINKNGKVDIGILKQSEKYILH